MSVLRELRERIRVKSKELTRPLDNEDRAALFDLLLLGAMAIQDGRITQEEEDAIKEAAAILWRKRREDNG
jgi:hypothetical protein